MLNKGKALYVYENVFKVKLTLLNFAAFQFCNEYAVPKDKLENFKDVTAKDIVCSQVFSHTLF